MARSTIILALALLASAPPIPALAADLSIAVSGVMADGNVRLQIHDSADGLQRQHGAVAAISLDPRAMPRQITLSGLPDGMYAVAAYQDSNGNGQLDRSFLGIPQEPYGFSNDQRGPDFAAAAIGLGHGVTLISIRLR